MFMMESTEWHGRYLRLAREVSQWSKDPSTKVGAVVIGEKGQVLSTGYNGFPRGVKDSFERLNDRPTKYKYVVHAEMNCIYNGSYTGVSLAGSTLYVWGLPVCSECAKGIIQAGISRVVIPERFTRNIPEKWKESWALTLELFSESGVECHVVVDLGTDWTSSSSL